MGNSFKLKNGKFRSEVRNKSFTQKVVSCWHRLSREAVGFPIPEGVQDSVGWSPDQPDLVHYNPTHGRGLDVDYL